MTIAKFTPSLLPPEQLEELFVAREAMLTDAIDRIKDAAATGRRSHLLLTGARGAGKTHLISLIHHRATQLPGFGRDFALARLEEDPWLIASASDLYRAIDEATEPGPKAAGSQVAFTIVFAENLDWILGAIGPQGQRELRARLERDRDLLIIASATSLSSQILDQAQPFYGFFDVQELVPFTAGEAAVMLRRLALASGDDALAAQLRNPKVLGRIKAVHHLTGGQPRIWAALAPGLAAGGLDDLAGALAGALDDLTPYYQEQLARRSPLERRVVKVLADAGGAMTVSAIARKSGQDPKSTARAITDLRRARWLALHAGPLVAYADKRQSYYELAEPTARLALQLKAGRGRELPPLLDFVTMWFGAGGLPGTGQAPHTGSRAAMAPLHHLLDAALAQLARTGEPALLLQLPTPLLALVEPVLPSRGAAGLRLDLCAMRFSPARGAQAALAAGRALDLEPGDVALAASCLAAVLDALEGAPEDARRRGQVLAAALRVWTDRPTGIAALTDLISSPGLAMSATDWHWLAGSLPPGMSPDEGRALREASRSREAGHLAREGFDAWLATLDGVTQLPG